MRCSSSFVCRDLYSCIGLYRSLPGSCGFVGSYKHSTWGRTRVRPASYVEKMRVLLSNACELRSSRMNLRSKAGANFENLLRYMDKPRQNRRFCTLARNLVDPLPQFAQRISCEIAVPSFLSSCECALSSVPTLVASQIPKGPNSRLRHSTKIGAQHPIQLTCQGEQVSSYWLQSVVKFSHARRHHRTLFCDTCRQKLCFHER